MEQRRILVVDDDRGARHAILQVLEREGHGMESAASGPEALELLTQSRFDLVLTDIRMDPMSGTDLLREIKLRWPEIPVIVMTAFAGVDTAVSAIHEGAYDYVSKPYEIDALRAAVRSALDHGEPQAGNQGSPDPFLDPVSGEVDIIGATSAMATVYKKIALVSRSGVTVLIEGETGSGKELVARAIHRNSDRRSHAFVAVNCGAFTESLLESELFGHVKGAFTGAATQKPGLFEAANNGTVFLDEIGETTPAMQMRLLRVIEERQIRRVGSMDSVPVNIRIIAASNRNIGQRVKEGAFREDLYYRLKVVTISVPPLRQRQSDVPLLFEAFVKKYGVKRGAPFTVDPGVIEMLCAYQWPGNVRELENAVERAIALNTTGRLTLADFSESLERGSRGGATFPDPPVPLEEIERQYVEYVISKADWNMTRAAEILEIDRRTLYRMLDRFRSHSQAESEPPKRENAEGDGRPE